MPDAASPPSPPATDSPMFWLLLFGSTALLMLAVIEPKFAKRQERLERMSQSRVRAAQAISSGTTASGKTASDGSVYTESPRWQATQRPTLRPLIFFIALVLLAASLVMRFRSSRPRLSDPRLGKFLLVCLLVWENLRRP